MVLFDANLRQDGNGLVGGEGGAIIDGITGIKLSCCSLAAGSGRQWQFRHLGKRDNRGELKQRSNKRLAPVNCVPTAVTNFVVCSNQFDQSPTPVVLNSAMPIRFHVLVVRIQL